MKSAIKKVFNNLGLCLERVNINNTPMLQTLGCITNNGCDVVLDVGANEGQFAEELITLGYGDDIISFEPSQQAHANLLKKSRKNKKWHVAERCAVGASTKDVLLNVSNNSVSSSILNITSRHVNSAPESRVVREEPVKQIRLDQYFSEEQIISEKVFLKVDTQGFEKHVLDGASGALKQIIGIQLELSLSELYQHQALWKELTEYLLDRDYYLWGIQPGFYDPVTYQLHQFDGIFVRN